MSFIQSPKLTRSPYLPASPGKKPETPRSPNRYNLLAGEMTSSSDDEDFEVKNELSLFDKIVTLSNSSCDLKVLSTKFLHLKKETISGTNRNEWYTILQDLFQKAIGTKNASDAEEAFKIRCLMQTPNNDDIKIYSHMLHRYFQKNFFDKAEKLFAEMKNKGPQPNDYTYNIMISGYLNSNMFKEGYEIITENKDAKLFEFTDPILTTILSHTKRRMNYLAFHARKQEVLSLGEEFFKLGIDPRITNQLSFESFSYFKDILAFYFLTLVEKGQKKEAYDLISKYNKDYLNFKNKAIFENIEKALFSTTGNDLFSIPEEEISVILNESSDEIVQTDDVPLSPLKRVDLRLTSLLIGSSNIETARILLLENEECQALLDGMDLFPLELELEEVLPSVIKCLIYHKMISTYASLDYPIILKGSITNDVNKIKKVKINIQEVIENYFSSHELITEKDSLELMIKKRSL